ncbi:MULTISPECIES: TRAP transporter large permease [Anaerotruncus]|uniref:TRAP transporter large permease n=1 Tax=Anaerotruncus TaxID=244127 RepID=UPI001A9AAF64|nr:MULTISPECIES: TRAP transporter large permease [Anaerotruncus]
MIILIMLGILFLCLIFTVPIAAALGISCISVFQIFYPGRDMVSMLAQATVTSIDSFSLLAIPFFMLVGSLMEGGGIAQKLVDVSNVVTGKRAGGLANAAVVASCFFAAISGSGPATAAAIGGIMCGAMQAQGYSKGYSGAIIAAGSTIGPVIPPSIPMIMYGITVGVSVSYMFMGGIIPGLLMGVVLIIWNKHVSKKRGYYNTDASESTTIQEKLGVLWRAIPAILMPIIVLGGIYSGVFTPTESAIIGCVYSLIVSTFVYRSLTWKAFKKALVDAGITSATIMILFGAANTFGRLLTMFNVPTMMTDFMFSVSQNKYVIMLLINLMLLLIGMFLDTISSILLFSPIFAPIAAAIGFDPLHFGIIMVINLCIGMITPPMGGNLFVAQRVSGSTFEEIFKDTLPMIIVLYLLLLVLIFVPDITMFLPRALGYIG